MDPEVVQQIVDEYLAENPPSGSGTPGRGISSIARTAGDGSPGTTDTYTITYTDGSTSTYTAYNGADGATPEFSIGTVETLEAESEATASITGTPEKPVLNLGIPRGPAGEGSDIAVSGASVGQTVKIAAVDTNGVPTAWEAVDLPGEKKWELPESRRRQYGRG